MSQPTGQPATPAPTTGPATATAPGAPTTEPAPATATPAGQQTPGAPAGQTPVYAPPGYMLVPQTGQAPAQQGPQYVPTIPLPQQPADPDGDDLANLPAKARKVIEDLRRENASRRVSERSAVVGQHALAAAGQLGANPAALLGSAAFGELAKTLDPGAADFPQKLTEAIGGLLQANPWMAAQPAQPAPTPAQPAPPPATSGGDFAAGTGAGVPITEAQLAQMSAEQIAEALAAGKLKHLL